jgi:epsilon-lactone hydrolase
VLRVLYNLLAAALFIAVRRLFRGPRLPGWSYRYEVIAELLRRNSRGIGRRSAEQVRREMLPARVHPSIRAGLKLERRSLGGRPTEVFTPLGWKNGDPTLLYLHGGGYVVCSPATHRDLVSRIAVASGARAFAVDYRKAPEHPFPIGIDDCEAAYRELLASGVAPDTAFIAGDSAGGGLTLATLLRAKEHGLALPRAAVLLSPWVDLECRGESIKDNHGIDYLSADGLEWGVRHYLQATDRRHPLATFGYADLCGLPPLLIQTGGAELFLSEHRKLVEHALAAGVAVVHEIEPHMVHVWQLFASYAPGCEKAIERIGAFIRGQGGERRRGPSSAEDRALDRRPPAEIAPSP